LHYPYYIFIGYSNSSFALVEVFCLEYGVWSVEWLKWLEVEVEVEVVGSKALGGYDYT
jgi:hypothetical protein